MRLLRPNAPEIRIGIDPALANPELATAGTGSAMPVRAANGLTGSPQAQISGHCLVRKL
jgi:hypothetical protein